MEPHEPPLNPPLLNLSYVPITMYIVGAYLDMFSLCTYSAIVTCMHVCVCVCLSLTALCSSIFPLSLQAGSLNKIFSMDTLTFEPKSVFLFLHTPSHGPHLHTVHVWVGAGVSHFAVQSAYQHAMRLVQHTPGRPIITKEVRTYTKSIYFFLIGYRLILAY